MSNEQIMEIVRESTHEVLDKYLTGKLLFMIEREIETEVVWKLNDQDEETEE